MVKEGTLDLGPKVPVSEHLRWGCTCSLAGVQGPEGKDIGSTRQFGVEEVRNPRLDFSYFSTIRSMILKHRFCGMGEDG